MKFVLLGPVYPLRGGIAHYTGSLYRELSADHQVEVVSYSRLYPRWLFPGKRQSDQSRQPLQVPVLGCIDSIGPGSWKEMARRIDEYEPDAVVAMWWHPLPGLSVTGLLSRLECPAMRIFLCHNVYPHESLPVPLARRVERFLIRRAFRQSHGFLVHAGEMSDQIRAVGPDVPIRRIFHPSYDFFPDQGHVRKSGRAHILFFGKVRAYKGLDILLEALGRIRDRMDFQLTVAGEFYIEQREFRDLAGRLELADRVVWKDYYVPNEEVAGLFSTSDVVVLPYRSGTQSGVVPLAYQFGIPVIAGDVGGLREVVQEGRTGYLVPPEDPARLARAILDFFERADREQMTTDIQAFRERLNWRQVVDAITGLINDRAGEGQ